MDKYTKESLNRLIDYTYDAEHTHFQECENDEEKRNHIFKDIKMLSDWLKNNQ